MKSSSDIETLTADERETLIEYAGGGSEGDGVAEKALRIIDAAAAEVEYLRDVLDLVNRYADTYGHDLVPHGPDTYGEGIRAAKRTIKNLLAHKAAKKGQPR